LSSSPSLPSRAPWQGRLPFFYGWVIVELGFFTSFFGIGLTWAASIFAVPMRDELGWTRSEIFFAVSMRGWIGIFASPIVGRYLDQKNGVRIMTLIGGLLNATSLMLISRVEAQWQFLLLFGVMGGLSQNLQGGISIAIVPKWFIARRASAVLISSLGGGLAALTLPLFLAPLIDSLGWRDGWVVIGVLALMFSVVPVMLLRRQPEDIGLLPDGGATSPRAAQAARIAAAAEVSFTREEAMRTSTFWLLMAGVAIGSLACNGVPTQVTNMFTDRGFALETASAALIAYGIASVGARFFWARIIDRYHLRTVLIVISLYGAFAMSSFMLLPESLGRITLLYGGLVGFFVGAYVPLHGLVWAVYFGRAHVGAISGAARPLGIILISSGPFLLAGTRDVFGSYAPGLLLTSAALLICAGCMYLAKPFVVKEPVAAPVAS
jgi:sugar phosphate permease